MNFISVTYLVALLFLILIYYMIPKNGQWITLLVFSIIFYSLFSVKMWIFLLFTTISTYCYGKYFNNSKIMLFLVIFANTSVLILLKVLSANISFISRFHLDRFSIIVPIGISFYTLQSIAYMVDVYQKKTEHENNFFKYLLFMTFFPQILQGPIPRFKHLKNQLFQKHYFSEDAFLKGFYLLIWGFFQKMVIADRCNIVVNQIFDHYTSYEGLYYIIAAILYSIQLYTDFAGCVCIAIGTAQILGIELEQNFNHPYFSTSIKDFWHRWHISLSNFLKDYIYIPLGGNRKGVIRKYINLLITFFISGIWHGIGLHFIVWGLLHGIYQVLGEILIPVKNFLMKLFGMAKDSISHVLLSRIFTFILVTIAWVFFRVESVKKGIYILIHMFTKWNPWILFSGEIYTIGIKEEEWLLLILSFILMIVIAYIHEKKIQIRDVFIKQPLIFRWVILMVAIFTILITGIYGPGYDSAQFIYGGF